MFARLTLARTIPFVVLFLAAASMARAQDPPPRIPLFVVDLHGTFPRFPSDVPIADSRGLQLGELPGPGLGFQVGAHFYPLKWKAITFGIGGEFTANRSRSTPAATADPSILATEERFSAGSGQLSFNFGTGSGWSYISGGIGQSQWSIVPAGQEPFNKDVDRLKTVNYGGGARWFIKPHLAFSFDVRFYAISPTQPEFGFPGGPRTTLLIIGAGMSLK
jgi:hypothetical protein